ncbi:MAG TPA: peptide chain release factor 2 [Saccharofermentans sp.]|jgi:peptide chain release factor 2|nr:peptide chain release factor 2 [Clostridia bacterium]HOO48248.1 peptide chain release factor 2 [Saccharofermentans sp.]HPE28207.1 peptide chain release factor 2 [Saccharofermentans sp.]HPJ81575.1 peptide chain release factor 2 [Saccharofermentans sp.]HPQ31744.1 peptide chain release factor 2 [Saccharofermentans sp.]
MLEYDNIRLELEGLEGPIDTLKDALHIEHVMTQISELESRTQEPDFWNDVEKAQHLQTKLKRLQKKVDSFMKLCSDREDLLVMCELCDEAEDAESVTDVTSGLEKLKDEYEKMRLETLLTGEYDKNNAILTLHAGAGGTEAQDWVEMLYRMYTRWAEMHGFEIKELDYLDGDEAGIKSCSLLFTGENAYGFLRSEMGVHRLVRISPFDASGRRHTSFASCEIMPELDDTIDIKIDMTEVRVDTYRATGKGGQHINKTDSAVRLTHIPTGCVVACQSERSQVQNKETAMSMLKAKLFALAQAAQMEKIEDLKGNQMDIAWGSQIRSYVFCPYTLVKDHRTGFEVVDVDNVMDGNIDGFINAFLSGMKIEK